MFHELTVSINAKPCEVFFQNGFYSRAPALNKLHKHSYPEIHIIIGGSASFQIDNRRYTTGDFNVLLIPPGQFHCCDQRENSALHTAFQISCEERQLRMCSVSADILEEFFREIEKCRISGEYAPVASYITFICGLIFGGSQRVRAVEDYAFLINEFFSVRYHEDLHIHDLADELHLSLRQTERLVLRYTGRNFREELSYIRMKAAKHLMDTTDLSLGEIARKVGYNSYSGFWKAAGKYGILY